MNLGHDELGAGTFGWYDFREEADILLISKGQAIAKEILPWRCHGNLVQAVTIEQALRNSKEKLFDYILVTGEQWRLMEQLPSLLEALKEDGVILLALDNRYGARRIAGEARDGQLPFEVLERGYGAYTRAEIAEYMEKCGIQFYSVYYPVPDWQMPQLLYSDTKLPGRELDERLIRLQQCSATLIADEYQILRDAVANDGFRFAANAFLVECSRRRESLSKAIFATFTSDRGKERSLSTVIYSDGRVKKACMFKEGRRHLQRLMEAANDLITHGVDFVNMRYIDDTLWMQFMKAPTLMEQLWISIRKDSAEYMRLWGHFWEIIQKSSAHVSSGKNIWLSLAPTEDWGPVLERAYVEMNALNCFYNEGKFVFFDQEYCFHNCPAIYMLYRSIYNFYLFYPEAEQYVAQSKVINHFHLEKLWLLLQKQDCEEFLRDVRNWDRYATIYDWANKPRRGIKENRSLLAMAAYSEEKRRAYTVEDILHPDAQTLPYGLANRYPIGLLPQKVALYGAGKFGRCLYKKLQDDGWHEVIDWVDENAEKFILENMPVSPVESILEYDTSFEAIVIAVLKKNMAEEIRQRLQCMRVPDNKILWMEPPWP
ncbi:hypothetical protein [Selenomonas sp. KH1T6]|uniref:hypothetical protein n=1 Tax=Selenomonas sp. KH1T6 TaxID=3158784 RepID=UPI0008A7B100|nr:hypothetical protein SAMN05216583_10864 [Selenomonas ruminantium]